MRVWIAPADRARYALRKRFNNLLACAPQRIDNPSDERKRTDA